MASSSSSSPIHTTNRYISSWKLPTYHDTDRFLYLGNPIYERANGSVRVYRCWDQRVQQFCIMKRQRVRYQQSSPATAALPYDLIDLQTDEDIRSMLGDHPNIVRVFFEFTHTSCDEQFDNHIIGRTDHNVNNGTIAGNNR